MPSPARSRGPPSGAPTFSPSPASRLGRIQTSRTALCVPGTTASAVIHRSGPRLHRFRRDSPAPARSNSPCTAAPGSGVSPCPLWSAGDPRLRPRTARATDLVEAHLAGAHADVRVRSAVSPDADLKYLQRLFQTARAASLRRADRQSQPLHQPFDRRPRSGRPSPPAAHHGVRAVDTSRAAPPGVARRSRSAGGCGRKPAAALEQATG